MAKAAVASAPASPGAWVTVRSEILERIPAGRWGRAEDIAGAALFLASAASDYVCGVLLPVDGGWLAR